MGIVVVTRNYQITLPKDARAQLGVKLGDKMVTEVNSRGEIILKPFEKDVVGKVFGIWKGMKETGIEYTNRVRKEWDERAKRLGI